MKNTKYNNEYLLVEQSLNCQSRQIISGLGAVKDVAGFEADKVIVCGMGGSRLPALILRSALADKLNLPLIIVSDYDLPVKLLTKKSLVIAISYSGNTEEVLSAVEQAKENNCFIYTISSGGQLATNNHTNNIVLNVDENVSKQPRYGVGYMFGALFGLLQTLGIVEMSLTDFKQTIIEAEKMSLKIKKQLNTLSLDLYKKTPIFVGAEHLSGMLELFQNQIHETAKNFACQFVLPNLNHHLLEGLVLPTDLKKKYSFIFLNSDLYRLEVKTRLKLTNEIVKKQQISSTIIKVTGTSYLSQALALLFASGQLSLQLAKINQVNPMLVPWVDYLKKEIKEISYMQVARLYRWLAAIVVVVAVNFIFLFSLNFQLQNPDIKVTYRHPKEGSDQMVYFSMMEQASQGKFLLKNLYTSESQLGMISPLWYLLGKVKEIIGLPTYIVFNLTIIVFDLILIFLLFKLSEKILKYEWQRILTIVNISVFGGFGWLFFSKILSRPLEGVDIQKSIIPSDLWHSEAFGYHSLHHSPLFILSQILLLILFWFIAEKVENVKEIYRWLFGLLALFLTIIHPYDAVILGSFIIVFVLIEKRQVLIKWICNVLPIIIGALLGLIYFYWLKQNDISFAGWSMQNVTKNPNLWNYLIGYGVVLPFVGYNLKKSLTCQNKTVRWLTIWLLCAIVLIFIPIGVQRRFANGVYLPLLLIASYYWFEVSFKIKISWQKIISFALVLIFSITYLSSTTINIILLKNKSNLNVVSTSVYQAFKDYRQASSLDDVLLTSPYWGNLVPAFTARKVYVGHGHQTNNWPEKKLFSEHFYSGAFNNEDMYYQLISRGIDYVWYGKYEQELGDVDLTNKKFLLPIIVKENVIIYSVQKPEQLQNLK